MIPTPDQPQFWDAQALDKELRRVFEICETCRRCYPLCPSFRLLLDGLDQVDGDVDQLPQTVIHDVVDYCYQCKLCYPHCPYIPPHRWEIDFPRLMLWARAVINREHGVPRVDRILGAVDTIGKMATRFAPIVNWANQSTLNRKLTEKVLGISHKRKLPTFNRTTFQKYIRSYRSPVPETEALDRIVLFHTCYINYQDLALGVDLLKLFERLKIHVTIPPQVCCGMPYLDGGMVEKTRELARQNVSTLLPFVQKGMKIISPGPTCSYMLRRDYPYLLDNASDAQAVADATRDACEYLNDLIKSGRLALAFTPVEKKILYHVPCHLRAQNVGFQAIALLESIPGVTLRTVEQCTGMDGTWGMKARFFDESVKVAEPLVKAIQEEKPDLVVTDCPLAGLQIEQLTGYRPQHPLQILLQSLKSSSIQPDA